ncbi:HdeD family acid-resistance protein [Nocardioides albus]|uniref:Uncharacterized membrane protein HdeD (DUF308 family) n=1 Tax=Nocardioides albus TaxID=1841 RepID=A0A7W5FAB5_9ACTN|nr:HdeD family acid-resistance protein [Nocardioides albus]MBB3091103.1 uncharacterized membrane protein HdeD (DUF308 family) [Nocardioides albus]GGU34320.1 hypothetical protein GCM10007979_36820 [Nocardioides albus]
MSSSDTPNADVHEPDPSVNVASAPRSAGSGGMLDGLGDYWGLVLAYGLTTTALGITLAVWPKQTLGVCAVIIAIQIIVSGVFRLISAIGGKAMEGGLRAVVGFSGALAIIVGLLFLRDPVQTVLLVTILLGIWWVVGGVVDILGAVLRPSSGRRGWDIFAGAITVLAGLVLLINPEVSLGALVVISCVWLIVIGIAAVVMSFRLRAENKG